MSGNKITLKDIARKAGVSTVAASIALKSAEGATSKVSSETRDKVRRIADQYNYKPNIFASSLRRKSEVHTAFISDRFNDLSNNQIRHLVLQKCAENKTNINFLNFDKRLKISHIINEILAYGFDRLIIFRFWDRFSPDEKKILDRHFGRNLLIINYFNDEDFRKYKSSFIYTDVYETLHARFSLIKKKKRKKTAVFSHNLDQEAAGLKYFNSIKSISLEKISSSGEFDFFDYHRDVFLVNMGDTEAICDSCREVIAKGYDVILAHNDQMTPMIYKAVKDCGKNIPEDMGIIGNDDIYFAAYMDPPLTTIRMNMEKYADAVWLWLRKNERNIEIPFELVERESI